ncbi:hypothetical protein NDU88_006465 [Pleurodeles waltl]|uniref:Uncharacterized protein n=1 Tax=Pleurodeles waltl TaxID=8319 RepID=A0AAV7TEF3_PLEWA|nr:hypothetical protein NDU88_006465 [Pleurodeles waltl]
MGCEVTALAGHTVAVGGRRPLCEDALVNIEAYGFQEPMTMCAGRRGTHRRGERPPENRYLACHRRGSPELGGPQQTGHPLPQEVGGHPPQNEEDRRNTAGDGLQT